MHNASTSTKSGQPHPFSHVYTGKADHQGEGQGGIAPLCSFLPPTTSCGWQGQGAGLACLETPRSPLDNPQPQCTLPRHRFKRQRSPKQPPLTASCVQSLVRQRLWRRSGGLGTQLWSAWEAPRTQQQGRSLTRVCNRIQQLQKAPRSRPVMAGCFQAAPSPWRHRDAERGDGEGERG